MEVLYLIVCARRSHPFFATIQTHLWHFTALQAVLRAGDEARLNPLHLTALRGQPSYISKWGQNGWRTVGRVLASLTGFMKTGLSVPHRRSCCQTEMFPRPQGACGIPLVVVVAEGLGTLTKTSVKEVYIQKLLRSSVMCSVPTQN